MGSITKIKKLDKSTGKIVTVHRAYVRRKGYASKSKVFSTASQAKDWLRNNDSDASLTKASKGLGRTFKDVAEAFADAPPAKGTKYWEPSHIAFWIAEFGLLKVGAISRGDINAAKSALQVKPAYFNTPDGPKPSGKTLSAGTVNRYLASLSSVFNYAMNNEIIDAHPMKGGKVSKLTENNNRTRILTPAEEQRLFVAAEASTWPMMKLYLRVLLTTGARKSEVLNLQWKHVDFVNSVALLHNSKNASPRAMPLVADVREALEDAHKVRPLHSDFVFFDPRHPERQKNIDVIWKNVRARAGLEKDRDNPLDRVVLHTTRHTAATKMLRGGANIAQAAKVTGHKTLAMLNRYTHLSAQDSVDLAEKHLAK